MPHLPRRFVTLAANRGRQLVPRPQRNATRWRRGFRAMARREEGEYSTYSTDEQRRQRAKDQARWLQNVAVEALVLKEASFKNEETRMASGFQSGTAFAASRFAGNESRTHGINYHAYRKLRIVAVCIGSTPADWVWCRKCFRTRGQCCQCIFGRQRHLKRQRGCRRRPVGCGVGALLSDRFPAVAPPAIRPCGS